MKQYLESAYKYQKEPLREIGYSGGESNDPQFGIDYIESQPEFLVGDCGW